MSEKIPTFIQTPQGVVNAADVKLPERAFREAWVLEGSAIEIDLAKAKDIARDAIRVVRAPKLADLDTKFMRALERGEAIADIVASKAKLRDATEDKRLNVKSAEKLKLALDAIVAEIESI